VGSIFVGRYAELRSSLLHPPRRKNQFSFRRSARSRPLNDSINRLSVGFPGRLKSNDTLPRAIIVGSVELFDYCGGERLLRKPERLALPIAPQKHPQPVCFLVPRNCLWKFLR
jgi:hypothetical protein